MNFQTGWLNWMEAKVTSHKNKEKHMTSKDISDMDQTTTINPLDHLLLEKRIKGCVCIVENDTWVTNAMNILTRKAENLK